MRARPAHALGTLICGWLLVAPIPAAAQVQVPIHGVTGTISPPGNVDEFYKGVEQILVKTGDGIEHLTKGKKPRAPEGDDALERLRPGTTVAVHYTVKGFRSSADDLSGAANEGVVARVDRGKKRVTVKFADGATETLRLAHHMAADPDDHTHSRVVLTYPDESGQRVALYFKPAD